MENISGTNNFTKEGLKAYNDFLKKEGYYHHQKIDFYTKGMVLYFLKHKKERKNDAFDTFQFESYFLKLCSPTPDYLVICDK